MKSVCTPGQSLTRWLILLVTWSSIYLKISTEIEWTRKIKFIRIRSKWATASSQHFLQTTSDSNNQTWKRTIIDLIQHYMSYQSLVNYLLTPDYSLESTALLTIPTFSSLTSFRNKGKQDTYINPVINLFSI